MRNEVILVDERDEPLGVQDKDAAHREGRLHRAISVFVFSSEGRWLLQRRHPEKYHSGGLWSNTCCSHPQPGEDTTTAAAGRLAEEMGLHCPLQHRFTFLYRHRFANGLTEHELDHVFLGVCDREPNPDPREIVDWRWLTTAALQADIAQHPEEYSYWFRLTWNKAWAEHERLLQGVPASDITTLVDLRRESGGGDAKGKACADPLLPRETATRTS